MLERLWPQTWDFRSKMQLSFAKLLALGAMCAVEIIILGIVAGFFGFPNTTTTNLFVTLVLDVLFVVNVLVIYRLDKVKNDLLPTWQHVKHDLSVGLLWGVTIFLLSIVIGIVFSYIYRFIGIEFVPQTIVRELTKLKATPAVWLAIAVITLGAPIGEEFIFRGVIHRTLAKALGPYSALILSGFLFAVFHGDWLQLPQLWFGGICLAIAYHKSHSLLGSIVAHFTMNVIPLALLLGVSLPV